jgi:hypothetical protein
MKALTILLLAPASAGAFSLTFPVDCTLTETCFIQQYVDHDAGPQARDFTCGPLSYDGHKGTDIAVPTLADMEKGVTVRAAAAGTVRATRDGLPDIMANAPDAPDINGQDCGNGVVLAHPEGWETQYCHLKRGSIKVRQGQSVSIGTPLGQIGLSGNTEFPHLHLSLRHNGQVVDPFSPTDIASCDAPAPSLFSPALPFQAGGLIAVGFGPAIPNFDAVKSGTAVNARLPQTAPVLALWAHLFGTRPGDRLIFTVTGPDGQILHETVTLSKTQARAMRTIGKRRPPKGWPKGSYTGIVAHQRGLETLGQKAVTVEILP